MVPLNETAFVADLIKALDAKVILVSKNYLGSINHSLLTAKVCRDLNLPVIGWIFNHQYLDYEEEIVRWSKFPKIATVPYSETTDGAFINSQAAIVQKATESITMIKSTVRKEYLQRRLDLQEEELQQQIALMAFNFKNWNCRL